MVERGEIEEITTKEGKREEKRVPGYSGQSAGTHRSKPLQKTGAKVAISSKRSGRCVKLKEEW